MQAIVSAAQARQLLTSAAASGSADDMLQAGAYALRAGAQADALPPVREAAQRHPGNARLWQLLGILNRDLGDLPAAVEAFGKAAKLMPGDAMIANGHACVSYEAGLPAVKLFEEAIRLNPSDRALLLRLTAARIDEGQSDLAIGGLEDAVRRHPDWTEAHSGLAKLKWARGDRDRFAESFENAIGAAPRNAALWQSYAELLSQDELHQQALDVVLRAKAALGALPALEAVETVARAELGQVNEAGTLFPRALQTGRLDVIVAFLRFLLRAGRPQEAAIIAERNIVHAGNHLWPYLSVAWRLIGDKRWEWLEGDPTLIGVYDIADSLPKLDELADRLRSRHRAVVAPLDQSLRGGTQTDGDLLSPLRAQFADLRQAVLAAVEQHVAQLAPYRRGHPTLIEQRSPISLAGSWSVRLTEGGHHVDHTHPAGWISSALYIALPSEAEGGSEHAGWLSLGVPHNLCPDLAPIKLVEPKPGRLVLFPSTMWHGTRPFEKGERLTVAFDVKRPA